MEAKAVVRELMRRLGEGDSSAIDEFMAVDMVNHAAGPQGRRAGSRSEQSSAVTLGRQVPNIIRFSVKAAARC